MQDNSLLPPGNFHLLLLRRRPLRWLASRQTDRHSYQVRGAAEPAGSAEPDSAGTAEAEEVDTRCPGGWGPDTLPDPGANQSAAEAEPRRSEADEEVQPGGSL